MLKKLTPVLYVERIEDQLPFWVERLGFEKTVEVPHAGAIGFVILVRDGIELMLQSHASVAEDVPALRGERARVPMFFEVGDLDDIERRLEGIEKVFPRRKTFYGAMEVAVRDPAGNVVTFAQFTQG
ncbi:MAG TPA: VOC family protein [Gammaproteobacteria bacterium]